MRKGEGEDDILRNNVAVGLEPGHVRATDLSILPSYSVVVGERRLSVSDRMADSSMPATAWGSATRCVSARCATMAAADPHGRRCMKSGAAVTIASS